MTIKRGRIAGYPTTGRSDSLRTAALQTLIGGVVGGVLGIVAPTITLIGIFIKLKGSCNPGW